MTSFNNIVPRSSSESRPSSQCTQVVKSCLPGTTATKKAGFGNLSVCANRRIPSRASRRFCTVIPSACGDRTRDPWVFNPRLRSQHGSQSRGRSTRIPTASSVVGSDLPKPVGLSASVSVPHLSCPISATAPPGFKFEHFPAVSTMERPSPSDSRRSSLVDRARRAPSSSRYPPMRINASVAQYTLDISLPFAIKPEMVTITTAKGDKLKIVADAWNLEVDCHFEWEIEFSPNDIDFSTIRAKFDAQARLTITAGRRSKN